MGHCSWNWNEAYPLRRTVIVVTETWGGDARAYVRSMGELWDLDMEKSVKMFAGLYIPTDSWTLWNFIVYWKADFLLHESSNCGHVNTHENHRLWRIAAIALHSIPALLKSWKKLEETAHKQGLVLIFFFARIQKFHFKYITFSHIARVSNTVRRPSEISDTSEFSPRLSCMMQIQ